MAARSGSSQVVKVANSGGTLVDISDDISRFVFDETAETDVRGGAKKIIRQAFLGRTDYNFEIVCDDSTVSFPLFRFQSGKVRAFEFNPEGTDSGDPKYTASFLITQVRGPYEVGRKRVLTVTCKPDENFNLVESTN